MTAVIRFGSFELDLTDKRLSESGSPFHLGKKALEILIILASRAGEIVSKEELLELVWPSTTVDEGALRVHLVTLRKVLGNHAGRRCIENVPGRGYVFVAHVDRTDSDAQSDYTPSVIPKGDLPRIAGRLIGRDDFIESSLEMLGSTRLLTIAGAGGIGKTSVALAVAEHIGTSRQVVFVDLAVLKDEALLMPTLGSALGLAVVTDDYRQAVLNALRESKVLLLLDNCEHLIDAVALTVDQILKASHSVSILATSREPLRVAGEKVRQLPSLKVPEDDIPVEELTSFPAVEFFVEAVKLASDIEEFGDNDSLKAAATIVRSLDGIPLAIELAASQVGNLGLASIMDSLDDPLSLLRRGRRTAPPRHQTLRATMDWSYDSLTSDERELFGMIAVFPGTFSSQAVESVASNWLVGDAFDSAFDGLLLKSLLSVSSRDGRYRLLDTTKGYAGEKLHRSPLEGEYRLAHALFCRNELLRAERDWPVLQTHDWMRRYAALIHDLRGAINWGFAHDGDPNLSVELTAISNVLWGQLGLMHEQLIAVEKAIDFLPASSFVDTDIELQLRISKGSGLYHTRGFRSDDQANVEFERAAVIADRFGNPGRIMRAYGGKSGVASSNGHYLESIEIAEALRARLPSAASFSRLLEHNYLFHGNFAAAREQAEISLFEASRAVRTTLNYGTGYDQATIARAVLAMVDFLEGKIDHSFSAIELMIQDAEQLGHSISTCLMLCLAAIPVAYLAGDVADARQRLSAVQHLTAKDMLVRWQEWVDGYSSIIPSSTQTDDGQLALERVHIAAVGMRLEYMTILAGCRASPKALEKALSGDAGWCRPELLRLKAVSLIKQDPDRARTLFVEGLNLARSMGAVFWELRCAICLFRTAPRHGLAAARDNLADALGRLEGTRPVADVVMARALLAS